MLTVLLIAAVWLIVSLIVSAGIGAAIAGGEWGGNVTRSWADPPTEDSLHDPDFMNDDRLRRKAWRL